MDQNLRWGKAKNYNGQFQQIMITGGLGMLMANCAFSSSVKI